MNDDIEEENCNVFSNKPTPILTGKDAERFHEEMEKNKNKKVSPERMAEFRKASEYLQKIFDKRDGKK